VQLITGRVNALLVSQAFFAAAASTIYSVSTGPKRIIVIRLIIIVAFSIVLITSCGICIGCQVLREWHQHGMKLIDKDVKGELQGFFCLEDAINQIFGIN
jgi:hypothetical protein